MQDARAYPHQDPFSRSLLCVSAQVGYRFGRIGAQAIGIRYQRVEGTPIALAQMRATL